MSCKESCALGCVQIVRKQLTSWIASVQWPRLKIHWEIVPLSAVAQFLLRRLPCEVYLKQRPVQFAKVVHENFVLLATTNKQEVVKRLHAGDSCLARQLYWMLRWPDQVSLIKQVNRVTWVTAKSDSVFRKQVYARYRLFLSLSHVLEFVGVNLIAWSVQVKDFEQAFHVPCKDLTCWVLCFEADWWDDFFNVIPADQLLIQEATFAFFGQLPQMHWLVFVCSENQSVSIQYIHLVDGSWLTKFVHLDELIGLGRSFLILIFLVSESFESLIVMWCHQKLF